MAAKKEREKNQQICKYSTYTTAITDSWEFRPNRFVFQFAYYVKTKTRTPTLKKLRYFLIVILAYTFEYCN